MDPESRGYHRPSFFPGDYVLARAPGTGVHQPHHHQLSQHGEPHSRRMFQFTNSSSSSSQLSPENPQPMDVAQQYPPQHLASLQSQTQINLDMLGDLLPIMPGMELDSSQDSNSNSTSQMVAEGGQLGYIPQVYIDHQFRLSQLHQLQQLQHHIFQQQIALLNGQTSGLLNGAPTFNAQRDQSLIFNGMPTPAPSGELRPQQQSLDFIAPMALNSLGDGASQGHSSGTSLPNSPATLHSAPGSVMSSPAFLASNSGHPSSNTFSTTPYMQAGSVSAPEHIAFQNHGLPPPTDFDLDISPLTSPWLGAQPNQPVPPLSSQLQNQGQSRQKQKYTRQQPDHRSSASSSPTISQGGHQYPSTPVTGPIQTSNNATNTITNNKRSASPGSTETDARKRQSPAVRPTNPGVFSPYLDQQPPTRRSNRTSTRSTSTSSSTPHLRGRSASTRQRKGSTAVTPVLNEIPGDSPSPVDLTMPPPAPPVPPNLAIMGSSIGSMSSLAPLTPVTPASIMNLDMKGKRLKIVTDSPVGVPPTSPATSRSRRGNVQGNMTAGPSLISPSLKPILPGPSNIFALTPASSANGSHHSPAMSASSIGPPQVRKSSHKAAEQKRRDSLKTTFDELRGLLPPIPLPSTPGIGQGCDEDGGANGTGGVASGTGGGSGSAGGIVFGNAVKPLLPGALPPRGPPKAGGEGPNKGVSKLQLLICGNEYLRTLKSRVERRDEEIVRLRKEVRKLRQLRQFLDVVAGIQAANPGSEGDAVGGPAGGGQEGGAVIDLGTMGVEGLLEELDLELDLDRDIDAVEKMSGLVNGALTGSGRRDDLLSSARSDITMDEDLVEDYED